MSPSTNVLSATARELRGRLTHPASQSPRELRATVLELIREVSGSEMVGWYALGDREGRAAAFDAEFTGRTNLTYRLYDEAVRDRGPFNLSAIPRTETNRFRDLRYCIGGDWAAFRKVGICSKDDSPAPGANRPGRHPAANQA